VASLGQVFILLSFACFATSSQAAESPAQLDTPGAFVTQVLPIVHKYCVGCHSTEKHKGSLDLERFTSIAQARKDVKPWQTMLEMLEAGEMPPKGKPQPTFDERKRLVAWVRDFLDGEARARAGDPGRVPMRRLSNAEYDYTVRDLTGVDLRPAREFPADGAGGEGFTNAAEALADVSPTLLNKYLLSAKEIAAHAVLLPDGLRFSPAKTRRDWSDESLSELRKFYDQFTTDGRLPLKPYLVATVRYRTAFLAGSVTPEEVAKKEKLNPKYLRSLWQALIDKHPSFPLEMIRSNWLRASDGDVDQVSALISSWQAKLWNIVPIGSYRYGNLIRQVPNNPVVADTRSIRMTAQQVPGEADVVLYLSGRELGTAGERGRIVWGRPRLEGKGKPTLLLRDYPTFGRPYEVDYAAAFADSAKYLAAVIDAADHPDDSVDEVARRAGLDPARLKRWTALLPLDGRGHGNEPELVTPLAPAVALDPLGEPIVKSGERPAINGWRSKGADLPVVVSNSSDTEEHIPGRARPHRVVVHPTPSEFVAAAWKSPEDGNVRVSATIAHAHPNCGNGVAWWLEYRRGDRAAVLAEGEVELGGETSVPARTLKVAKDDVLVLAVDAKNGDHSCDLTEIGLTITDAENSDRRWDLAADVADNVLDGNPHADKLGNKGTWSFVKAPSRSVAQGTTARTMISAESVLGRWRTAATDPARKAEAANLANEAQALFAGSRPPDEKYPDRILYDRIVSVESPLLSGLDLSAVGAAKAGAKRYGLNESRFGTGRGSALEDKASLLAAPNSVIEVRLPAALMRDREFVVEAQLDVPSAERVVQFEVSSAPPAKDVHWDGKSPLVGAPDGAGHKQLVAGLDAFRQCFPQFVCFREVIPVDEVVCLKMYHREDEPLVRLFLDDEQHRRIDRLWEEHRFITQQPVAENKYLPLFIGFVTQDQPKELLAYFESQREPFRKRAEDFEQEVESAAPKQLEALARFAARAYRRPLTDAEKSELTRLYQTLRAKGVSGEDAFRGVLARVLVSPSFLFRIEQPPTGKEPGPVSDWELATRLSYFLWSSVPDDALRAAAATGRLRDPGALSEQARRMLKDDRVRALGVEFGTQWIHVRGFAAFNEKSEKLYPAFDVKLRAAMDEESVLFFQDLFQHDEDVSRILDADYTYLNEPLARHYGIPGVTGPQWRKVDGVRQYGRGGILGFASVLAKQAGASRTSPVLRGNWVVETLLGEKLPRPPPDVPKLPEEEGTTDGLTMRQLVEKHTQVESCAVCHRRMDPFGFSLEGYDAIGRQRDRESTGLPIDCRAKLKDGTEFEGIDGLRDYLLTKKKDVIVRLFCRRLVGYALGRAVTLSDQILVDQMVAALDRSGGRVSAAVMEIVRSSQFRLVRGSAFTEDE
jgi:hypothetical protein